MSFGFAALLLLALVVGLTKSELPPMWQAALWGMVVLTSFVGYGRAVAHVAFPRTRIDVGLAAIWGASTLAFLGGLTMATSLCTRTVILLLVDAGVVLCGAHLVLFDKGRLTTRLLVWRRFFRSEPAFLIPFAIVVALASFCYLAAISNWHVNPYDDEIAYLPFVKRLLDTGTVIEPFSFRRMSAFGGQTFFAALFAPRTQLSQSYIFDHGLCVIMIAMLIVSFDARRGPPLLVRLVAAIFYLTLPSQAINTASYHSGTLFFLGLYRTLVFVDDRREQASVRWQGPLVLALVGGATCTLRQNYLPIPIFALGISYLSLFRVSKQRRAVLIEAAIATGMAAMALLPWMIAAWRSNQTFLFPVVRGTANPELQLHATGMSVWKELLLFVETACDGTAIRCLPIVFVVAALVRDRRVRKPLVALTAGSAIGFIVLVHSFTQSDAGNIGRYAFAFIAASVIALILQASRASGGVAFDRRSVFALLGLGIAICTSFYDGRIPYMRGIGRGFRDIDAHALMRTGPEAPRREWYLQMQAAVPVGAKMAILVDEPYHLDYARNPIYNLDMPGYSSPAPGEPFFQGSEKTAAYFRGLSVRYLCFVEAEYSRYHYQREFWIGRLMSEQELWRNFTPFILDFIDDLADIAKRYKVIYRANGLVVVDIQEANRGG